MDRVNRRRRSCHHAGLNYDAVARRCPFTNNFFQESDAEEEGPLSNGGSGGSADKDNGVEEGARKRRKQSDNGSGSSHYDGIVDVSKLDWEDMGIAEENLPDSKWMVREVSSGEVAPAEINMRPVVSPMIRPTSSPYIGPFAARQNPMPPSLSLSVSSSSSLSSK